MIRLNKTADIIYDKENLWHGSPQDQLFSSVRYLTLEIEVSLKSVFTATVECCCI